MLKSFGFNDLAVQEIINEGYVTLSEIGEITSEHLKSMCEGIRKRSPKLAFPSKSQFKLLVAQFYAEGCRRHGVVPAALDMADVDNFEEIREAYLLAKSPDREAKIDTPPKFGDGTKFPKWKQLVENYLQSTKGQGGIPLAYIIRESDMTPAAGTVFSSLTEKLIMCTPHTGEGFNSDNREVWEVLRPLLIHGPAWAYVRGYAKRSNGRGAWKALLAHYEGSGAINVEINSAYAAIKEAKYSGEFTRFNFESYANILQNAYETLHEYGRFTAEEKKVEDLIDGISIQNNFLGAAIAHIRATESMSTNFAKAVDYLALTVQRNKRSLNRRSVSKLKSEKKFSNKQLKLGNYSPGEWAALSPEQRQTVQRKRAEQKKRKAAALKKDKEENADSDEQQGAGDQMSRKKARHE